MRHRWIAALAATCVVAQLDGDPTRSLLATAIWLIALRRHDPQAVARLWLPRFWAWSLALGAASGLLLGPRDVDGWGLHLSRTGLTAGVLMVLRAIFLFSLTIWVSRSLNASTVQRLAARFGLAPLGTALPVAFDLLPEIETRFHSNGRLSVRGLADFAVDVVCHTARLAERIHTEQRFSRCPARVAVVGPPGSGKTTFLLHLVDGLQHSGISVGGVVQTPVFENGRRVGYRLRDVAADIEQPFASKRPSSSPDEPSYVFDPPGWQWARDRICSARERADVLVIDELGLLEARGEGHLPALLDRVPRERARVWLMGVRTDRASALAARLGPFDLVLDPAGVSAGPVAAQTQVLRFLEAVPFIEQGAL